MNSNPKYWINYFLLACYAFVITSAQFSVLGKLLNSTPNSAIATGSSKTQPFDGRLILTQWNYVTPTSNNLSVSESANANFFVFHLEKNEIIALPITYTTVISHFPYPPFWPRDPSLS
jgi:hypothetical protein